MRQELRKGEEWFLRSCWRGEGRKKRKMIGMEHRQFRDGKRNEVPSLRIEKETGVPSFEDRKGNWSPKF